MKTYHKIFVGLILISLICLVSGCATIFSGSPSTLSIKTVPKDVTVTVIGGGNKQVQHTPCSIVLDKKNDYTVILEYEGYRSEEVLIQRSLNGWVFGNILLGGIIGLAVDGVTGNMWNHNLNTINTELVKAKTTGMLPDKVTIEYPFSLLQDNGETVVQYIPVTFYRI
jgi:uncharacterized protein YceK